MALLVVLVVEVSPEHIRWSANPLWLVHPKVVGTIINIEIASRLEPNAKVIDEIEVVWHLLVLEYAVGVEDELLSKVGWVGGRPLVIVLVGVVLGVGVWLVLLVGTALGVGLVAGVDQERGIQNAVQGVVVVK